MGEMQHQAETSSELREDLKLGHEREIVQLAGELESGKAHGQHLADECSQLQSEATVERSKHADEVSKMQDQIDKLARELKAKDAEYERARLEVEQVQQQKMRLELD